MREIPGYELLRPIGRGGMATVYLAVQQSLGREVALKLLTPSADGDGTANERFLREARIAASLRHPNIVPIHDFGIHEGVAYLAMQYEPAGTVAPMPGERLAPREALQAVRDIARALAYAHGRGVVHRDIKPDNILRGEDGGAMLSDFGIARLVHGESALTREGTSVGTPHYMSPEQLRGERVDGRSDLYSLGVVLWQLLTGELPYTGADAWSIGTQHLTADIPRLPAPLAHLQPLLESLLAKTPEARAQSGTEVAARIDALLAGTVTPAGGDTAPAMPAAPRAATAKARTSRRILVGSALVLLLPLLAWYAWRESSHRPAVPPPVAAQAKAAPMSGASVPARSIAVLPFVNMSRDPANDYFSDGLAETALDMLSQVHDLKVIARTSSFAFKGQSLDVRQIGNKLDAAHLLEGSVQQDGKTVRITAQLVRTRDGVQLWSHRYDRQLTDVFKIQDEIATEVVKALQLALSASEAVRVTGTRTSDVGAYTEYLRGMALLPERRVPDLREALLHFQRAMELDPKYAHAYAQAGVTLFLLASHAGANSAQDKALRDQYVAKALALDPGLGEAYAARAALCHLGGDLACAEENYKRAIELAPNYASGWEWYGDLASVQPGKAELARRLRARAVQLDPLSPEVRISYASSLAEAGDRAGAMRQIESALRDNPRSALAHAERARLFKLDGDMAGALREYAATIAVDPEATGARAMRCNVMVSFGAFGEAKACFDADRALRQAIFASGSRLPLAMATGDFEQALRVAKSLQSPDPWATVRPLLALGRAREALALLQKLDPGMFMQPEPHLGSSYPEDGILAGRALLGVGAQAQGSDLLRRTLAANASRPILREVTGRGWTEVEGWALLGEPAKACAAVREAVAAGLFINLGQFDVNPEFGELRKDPCLREALAPARAKAAAQVAAARAAGLL
jgi:TolB-like protein/Tfp pilus assembly protein PilF